MKKVEIIKDGEGAPELIVDGVSVDRHFIASSPADFIYKAAYLIYRKFGFNCRHHLDDVSSEIKAYVHERFFEIDGEDATKYLACLPNHIPFDDMNKNMAMLDGYEGYKKLLVCGFNNHFAANTAYNMQLVLVDHDRDEILDALGLELK
jgi:hypothetical protein